MGNKNLRAARHYVRFILEKQFSFLHNAKQLIKEQQPTNLYIDLKHKVIKIR